MEPAARTKNMTHAALPRSEAFHLRLKVQARARNERQRGTIGLRVRQRSISVSLLLDNDNCGDKGNDSFDIKYMFSDILSNIRAFIIKINSIGLVGGLEWKRRVRASRRFKSVVTPRLLEIRLDRAKPVNYRRFFVRRLASASVHCSSTVGISQRRFIVVQPLELVSVFSL
ncbi:hypothetical protein EVAR_65111_1 [Eumeta japonica]|uniref:Uncharacterized protein n=1 Tax=Eumeta variegata TaxID=151549 RepID=A0A4C1ZXA0_EUMVA|nr:hypothetical protein EVAR_65111_1 [Eumeta japonica]